MKICIFCHDAYLSGANRSLLDWIQSDKQNQYFIVVPQIVSDFQEKITNRNVHLINGSYFCLTKELYHTSLKYIIKKTIKRVIMMSLGKSRYCTLLKTIQELSPDVIISNSFAVYYGAEIANDLGIPHIWHIREFMELDHKITHYDQGRISQLCARSHCIFISHAIEEYYTRRYRFLSSRVIYNRVNYTPQEIILDHKFADHRVRALMVGIISEGKGQEEAIRAVQKVYEMGYDISLDIYGSGPDEKKIRKYLRKNNTNYIKLKGFAKDIDQQRLNYDISLVCSANEAFGRVTVESMYYGNLLIAANTGGTVELINDKVALLYEKGDVNDLANKIIQLYENKNQWIKIIEDAKDYAVSKFSGQINDKIFDYIYNIKETHNNIL